MMMLRVLSWICDDALSAFLDKSDDALSAFLDM